MAPSHYIMKIESFSNLSKIFLECGATKCYKSKTFEANDYIWTLSIYPNGVCDSKGHISVFLRIEDTDALPLGWEIYTDLKFFIFDQKRDKYFVFQDGRENRFHMLKPECGIAKLISRDVFVDANNGYLVNDKCVFGVEVFVIKPKFAREYLSPPVNVNVTFTWRISDYNKLSSDVHCSGEFTAGSFSWKLKLYPLGNDCNFYGVNLGLFLVLVDPHITFAGLLVRYTLSIRNHRSGKHKMKHGCECFTPKSKRGWNKFVPLADLRDVSKGFMVDNFVIIEAQIKNVFTINSYASADDN